MKRHMDYWTDSCLTRMQVGKQPAEGLGSNGMKEMAGAHGIQICNTLKIGCALSSSPWQVAADSALKATSSSA